MLFGKLKNGENIYKYLLANGSCEIEVISYGGIITSIKVPDKNNNLIDVVLGFETLDPYLKDHPYFGAIVGRYANRIDNGKFTINANSGVHRSWCFRFRRFHQQSVSH